MKNKIEIRLQEVYQRQATWPSIFNDNREFSYHDSFVNIAIVGEASQQDNKRELLEKEKLFSKLDNDKYYNENYNKKAPSKVLLLGRAGIGKSVLSGYLAHRAIVSEEKLWSERFDVVFVIRLRDLVPVIQKNKKKEWSLAQIISQMCLYQREDEEEDKKNLLDDLTQAYLSSEEKKGKVLLILDGWDEVASFEVIKENEKTKEDENEPVREVLKTLLKFTNVLLTSRPYVRPSLDLKDEYGPVFKPELVLEHIGFLPEQLAKYIDQFFKGLDKGKEKATQLKFFIEDNRSVQSLMLIPLHAELVCSLWESHAANQERQLAPLGLSELYNKLLHYMLLRYLQKTKVDNDGKKWQNYSLEQLLQKCSNELFCLQQLAYEPIVKNKSFDLLLEAQQLTQLIDNENLTLDKLLRTQFLKRLQTGYLQERRYYFIHLIFQDYFAARFMAQQLMDKDDEVAKLAAEFIRLNKYTPRYQVMFWFIAGLIKSHKTALERFWGAVLAEPRDCIGLIHSQLVLGCLEECCLSTEKGPIDFKQKIEIEKEASAAFLQLDISELKPSLLFLRYTPKLYIRIYAPIFKEVLCDKKGNRSKQARLFEVLSENQLLTDSLFEAGIFLMQDEDRVVRWVATKGFKAWIAQGKASEEQVKKYLLPLLHDESWYVREAATHVFEAWIARGNATEEQVKKYLLPLLHDEIQYVREAATHVFEAWIAQGKASEEWVTKYLLPLLHDKDADVREAATETFKAWIAQGKVSKEIEYIVEIYLLPLLRDKDANVREAATHVFEAWIAQGKASEEIEDIVTRYLLRLLRDEDANVRKAAIKAFKTWLAEDKATEEEVTEYLLPLLHDEDADVRKAAIEAFKTWLAEGKATEEWVTKYLLPLLRDKSPNQYYVVFTATRALSIWVAQGKATEEWVTKYLLPLLRAKSDHIIQCGIEVFKAWIACGKASEEQVTKYLLPLLYYGFPGIDSVLSIWVEQGKATEEWVTKYLLPLLHHKADVRGYAIWVFEPWVAEGKASEEQITKCLLPLLHDESHYVREAATHVFEAWIAQGKATEEQVSEHLLPLLYDKDADVRKAAIKALKTWLAEGKGTEEWVQDKLWPAIQNNSKILSDLFPLVPWLGEITLRNYLQKKQPYQLCLMPNEEKERLKHNKIWLKKGDTENSLVYSVLNEDNQPKTSIIDAKELTKVSELEVVSLSLETLQPFFNDILQILAKRGDILSLEKCVQVFIDFLKKSSALVLINHEQEGKQTLSIAINGKPYFKTPFYLNTEEIVELKKAFFFQAPVKELVTKGYSETEENDHTENKVELRDNNSLLLKEHEDLNIKKDIIFPKAEELNKGNSRYSFWKCPKVTAGNAIMASFLITAIIAILYQYIDTINSAIGRSPPRPKS